MHRVSAEYTQKQTGIAPQTEHTRKDTALPLKQRRVNSEHTSFKQQKKKTAAPVRGILQFCEVRSLIPVILGKAGHTKCTHTHLNENRWMQMGGVLLSLPASCKCFIHPMVLTKHLENEHRFRSGPWGRFTVVNEGAAECSRLLKKQAPVVPA